jgi:hypothetical protein
VVVFTPFTWQRFRETGGSTAGFRAGAWGRVERLGIGDTLLAYVVNDGVFVGALRVAGEAYWSDGTGIWDSTEFPARIQVQMLAGLDPSDGIRLKQLVEQLPRLRTASARAPGAWGNFVRGSPRRWPTAEAEVVLRALATNSKVVLGLSGQPS